MRLERDNVDADARTNRERWSLASACRRGLHGTLQETGADTQPNVPPVGAGNAEHDGFHFRPDWRPVLGLDRPALIFEVRDRDEPVHVVSTEVNEGAEWRDLLDPDPNERAGHEAPLDFFLRAGRVRFQ